jgi:NADH:ubiquinone oxidoreductase subunit H
MRVNGIRCDDASDASLRADLCGAQMLGAGMALVWFGIVSVALVGCAAFERRSRLASLQDRPELRPPRAAWGFDSQPPPVADSLARALAGGARLVRSSNSVVDRAGTLASFGRIVSFAALASALSLVPFAGTWGGASDGLALVVVDLRHGLIALVFLVLLMGFAQVAVGLADRSVWSRLGSVRLACRNLGGLGLFVIVLAPLALETNSFRLHEIVFAQLGLFSPFSWLPTSMGGEAFEVARNWHWPNWNVFAQPLTAILFIPTVGGLIHRPWVYDSIAGSMATSGFGIDCDPVDLYWGRLEARLSKILAASLFVSLFLGAGAIPFVSTSAIVHFLQPFMGVELPAFLGVVIQMGVFVGKLMIVLTLISLLRRATAAVREDQWIGIMTRRLLPLAWANLLLMSAMTLLSDSLQGGR